MTSLSLWQRLRSRWVPTQTWGQWEAVPFSEVEDSLGLRILVQALVLVGIMATDVAASTWNSLWAVPLSVMGATWSWHSRRQRNILAKFGIALGMLVVLALFLGRLVSQENDSRILLAELLIQLQVLHTFDLPRRKDLGYSAIIGLVLLSVAATLSQTTTFGGFLLVFLAIALPVLVLDYRSRLGLVTWEFRRQWRSLDLAPKRLATLLLVVTSLGLLIFALIPRLPGYQLRAFPVSGQIEFEGEFDASEVVNPGYLRSGSEGNGTERGWNEGEGAETVVLNPRFYYGFNSEINQNLGGVLEPEVVMRVRSQAPGFWQVLAFDQYTGQGWRISRNEEAEIIKRSRWFYRFLVPRLFSAGNTKEVVQTYSITAEFSNLIPALPQAKEIYFPTREIAIDPEGSLRSPVALFDGLTYTVVSQVPYRDRALLRTAPQQYPPNIRQFYLDVPEPILARVRQQAQTLLATANRPLSDPYEQALFLAQALKQRYTLQPDLPPLQPGEDLVEAFLFKFGGGYPDHFSTTLTLMLRSLGIPARLAAGFAPGQFNPFTGLYVVKNTDAYALTEVFFPGYGWFAFDPIPGHDLFPPSVEVDQTFSVLQQFWNWVAGWLPSPVAGLLNGVFTFLVASLAQLFQFLSGGWSGFFRSLFLFTGLGLSGWLVWQGWRTWRYRRWLSQLSPMERLYQQMLSWLSSRGWQKRPEQTPLEYAQQVRQQEASAWTEVVTEISQAYTSWRYGRRVPQLQTLERQLRSVQKIQHQLLRSLDGRQGLNKRRKN